MSFVLLWQPSNCIDLFVNDYSLLFLENKYNDDDDDYYYYNDQSHGYRPRTLNHGTLLGGPFLKKKHKYSVVFFVSYTAL